MDDGLETADGHVGPVQRRRFTSSDDVLAAVRGALLMRNRQITVRRDGARQGGWSVEVWSEAGDGD
jgi:hypothetical protein